MLFVKPVYATCPVCIITVGGGLIIAKKLGIDDLLVSIWIAGLNTALAFWIASTMKSRLLNNPYLWTVGFTAVTLFYLWYTKQLFHQGNTFAGFDKIILGIFIGVVVFLAAIGIDMIIRKKNKGKVLFYYQKVIIPLLLLSLATIIFAGLLK